MEKSPKFADHKSGAEIRRGADRLKIYWAFAPVRVRLPLPAPPFAWSTSASAHASARLLCTQRLSESRDKACSGPQYRLRGKACQVIGFSCQFLLPTPARWLSRSLLKAQAKVSEASLCDFFCPVFTKCQPFRRPDALFRPLAGLQAIERQGAGSRRSSLRSSDG